MKRYFAYTRVSTVKQGERGSSLQEQKSAIEAYALRHGLSVVGWFEEMETAAKQGRPTFNRMLRELEGGRASGVIIHKIDRGARNLKDWAHLGELIDRGIEIHFAHESLDLNSRGGRLAADIQAVVSADYIRNLRDEVRKGMYGRLKQGFYPLPAPMGYLDRGRAQLKAVDPVKGLLVRQMFELYATSRFSLDLLRAEMHRRGLSDRRGRPLAKSTVSQVLKNPFYVGLIRIWKTNQLFEGKHPPLVDQITFDRVQAVLSGKAHAYVIKHGFTYRRLVRCGSCGRCLVGERQKDHVYYRCHGEACRGASVREEALESQLRMHLQTVALAPDELEALSEFRSELGAERERRKIADRQHCERTLGQISERYVRLTDAFIDGAIDKETFEERKAALLHEKMATRSRLEALSGPSQSKLALETLSRAARSIQAFYDLTPDERRDILGLTAERLELHGGALRPSWRMPFLEIDQLRKAGGLARAQ